MKAIIVDDEPKAISLLQGYLEHFNSIELAGTFRNGLKALEFIDQNAVELVFLDINMPHINGLAISKLVDESMKIVFTTAHPEFAVESYEVNAADYLLKPISFERFTKSVRKIVDASVQRSGESQEFVMVKSGAKSYRIRVSEILFLQKDGNYMIYHLSGQKVMARETIADALLQLPSYFVQTHKSYIINKLQIEYLNKEEISIRDHLVPIGHSFKEELFRILTDG